jgi:hypothetical protein
MPAPRIMTFAEYDKKEKPMSKKMKISLKISSSLLKSNKAEKV